MSRLPTGQMTRWYLFLMMLISRSDTGQLGANRSKWIRKKYIDEYLGRDLATGAGRSILARN